VSKKAWIIFAAVCIILLSALVFFSNKSKINVDNVDVNKTQSATPQSGNIADHVFGKAGSKVTFIEYGDYQCPGCGSAYPNIKMATEKYQGQVAFIFRNFPLVSLHPNARAAAAAAEAAGLQGKYWEMHNMLYEGQQDWGSLEAKERTDFFTNYAKELGINQDKFKTDLSSTDINQKISFDQEVGKKANVNATPTLYLNGKAVDQTVWQDGSKLQSAFADALKANGIAPPSDATE
jgi:protein-disulfide isomerase